MDVEDVVGTIEKPDTISYLGAYPFGDLLYCVYHGRAPRLQKLVRINSVPQGNGDLRLVFRIQNDNADIAFPYESSDSKKVLLEAELADLVKRNDNLKAFFNRQFELIDLNKKEFKQKEVLQRGLSFRKKSASGKRGVGFKPFRVWDSSGRTQFIDVQVEQKIGYIELTKIIPRSFLNSATFPVFTDTTSTFYPNADPESTSVDGYVYRGFAANETWATIRAGAGSAAGDNDTVIYGAYFGCSATLNQFNSLIRSIELFDTSSIGAGSVVSSSTNSIYVSDKLDNTISSPNWNVYGATPNSNTSLVSGDYSQTGTTEFSSSKSYADTSTSSYSDFILNSSGLSSISVTGITKLSTKNANYDVGGVQPFWVISESSYIILNSAETSGTSSDPKLVVTFSLPVVGGGFLWSPFKSPVLSHGKFGGIIRV